jgi:thymidylate synthase (FAD)
MKIIVPEAEEIIDKYFPVLDHGFVALVDYMGGDQSIERAARVSYGSGTRSVSDTRGLIRYLFRHKHSTPFEVIKVNLHIGLPIVAMRQLIRHRTASTSEYSGRYSILPMLFYDPPADRITLQSKTNKQGSGEHAEDEVKAEFRHRLHSLRTESEGLYRWAVEHDIARELARIDLPLSIFTYAYWQIDLRNMFNVIALRSDSHAQEEVRAYSDVFAGIVKRICPLAFDAFQDYQQTAVTFTQPEIKGLSVLCNWTGGLEYAQCLESGVRSQFNQFVLHDICGILCTKSGGESREQTEFWDKLKPRPKVDYSLDLSTAKPVSYYEDLVREHAVEVP